MQSNTLFIFSGRPGSGKSTLAAMLAAKVGATYLRIDTVEQALRDVCGIKSIEGMGYRFSYRLAQDQLRLGLPVVADSVNPWTLTREEWMNIAKQLGAPYVNIVVSCSNSNEHRMRLESRPNTVPGLPIVTWQDVFSRDYHEWEHEHVFIDTAGETALQSFQKLMAKLKLQ